MRVLGMLLTASLLTACDEISNRPPIAAYKRPADKVRAATLGLFGMPCNRPMESQENVQEFIGYENCYVLTEVRRFHGVWLTEFEASKFVPELSAAPTVWRWTPNDVDLSVGRSRNLLLTKTLADDPRRAYLIEFMGREIAYPGRNRFGGLDRRILVDRLISLRQVAAPKSSELCTPKCAPFPFAD